MKFLSLIAASTFSILAAGSAKADWACQQRCDIAYQICFDACYERHSLESCDARCHYNWSLCYSSCGSIESEPSLEELQPQF